nr:baseplate J/gp47 family protein [uncultured Enterobacter sp.]
MALNLDTLGLSATVTAQGIGAPAYQTILDSLTAYFQQIYGSDAYLAPDSKDGQMVALVALAIHDANNTAIAVYNAFSPTTAMSAALGRNVKINGIVRKIATHSTVDVTLTGTPGTTIVNGSVRDANGVVWDLPATVTVSVNGSVTVTATCATTGAIAALPATVTVINSPTQGWMAVTNPTAATVGQAAETDSALRIRQTQSVALPALTPFDALDGAIASVTGVTRHKLYENDTGATDGNGLPAHSLSAIVEGGDVNDIAQVIRGKKGQGVSTFGRTSVVVTDSYGNPHSISFSRPTDIPVYVALTLNVFPGYTTLVGTQMKQAIADYINALAIGDDVLLSRIYSPANLGVVSGGDARYYDIAQLTMGVSAGQLAPANINIAYDQSASCRVDNITITVTS